MLCLKVTNNKTNNHLICQSLFNFIKLTRSPIDKEPIRLNYNCNVINKTVTLNKKRNCSKFLKLLNIPESGHRANSKVRPLNNENWIKKY